MRYFFKLTDGEAFDDSEGLELPDQAAAEREATQIAAEWMRDNPETFNEESEMKVEILDDERTLVATVLVDLRRNQNVTPLRGQKA